MIMENVFNGNLIANASPHVRSKSSTISIMRDVCIALIPCVLASVFFYGAYAFILIIISVMSAVLAEALFCVIRRRPLTITDGSAVVTGLIVGLNLPASVPVSVPIIGSVFAVIVVKMVFGGLGKNFANPAATARLFLMLAYTSVMTRYLAPHTSFGEFFDSVDALTGPTPLGGDPASYGLLDLFLGKGIGGAMGETCKAAVLLGFVYLLIRKVISWRIPVTYVVSFAFFTTLASGFSAGSGKAVLSEVLAGGLLFGAVFMATDYATSPKTNAGRMLYALLLGGFTFLIRHFSAYNEGVAFSIVFMNLLVPLIDQYVLPCRFGSGKKPVLSVVLYSIFGAMAAFTVLFGAIFF